MQILRKGSKGADVRKLQEALQRHGCSLPRYGADSDFGLETETAVKQFQSQRGLVMTGEVGPATWFALGLDDASRPVALAQPSPPWRNAALRELGFHETGENRGIERYIALAHAGRVGDAWCAIFQNAMLESVGVPGTRSAGSQSFRHSPLFVPIPEPVLGAIAVYWRISKDSGLGHVGTYEGETGNQVLTLGGNESDAVRKQFEPKTKLWGYWWPKGIELPAGGIIRVKDEAGHPAGSVT